jgi:hypothetical protein
MIYGNKDVRNKNIILKRDEKCCFFYFAVNIFLRIYLKISVDPLILITFSSGGNTIKARRQPPASDFLKISHKCLHV